jgi:Integrase zinc binding domain/Integrase core domain
MDSIEYNYLLLILTNQSLPNSLSIAKQNQIQKRAKYFYFKNSFIYKIDRRKKDNLLRVLQRHELEPVLFMFHNDPTAAHFATDAMFDKIRSRYFWPQMYEEIRAYVQACDQCQRRGRSKKNQVLHPIPVNTPFYQIGIDFVGPLPLTAQGNRYIIVAMDYLTKWPEAKPVPVATAEQVANFLYEDIIGRHGCPIKILSDQGTHFKNNMIAHLMKKFQIKQTFSTPYHPQTNGLVERFNRTLCESLAKLSNEHKTDWDRYIAPVLFAYRTTKHNTTKFTPFYLMYGREVKLPMDSFGLEREHNLLTRLHDLVEDLPRGRFGAKEQIEIGQVKQKELYDKKIKQEQHFLLGQKVLYYKAVQDNQHTGKLLPKWKGSYFIHEVQPNGSYKIMTLDGKILKSPVNGCYLKRYFELLA